MLLASVPWVAQSISTSEGKYILVLMLKLLTHHSVVPPCLWGIANTLPCSLGAAHEFTSIYIIQYMSYRVDLQFLENKVCERPNNVWCIETNCLLKAFPRCSGEKYRCFEMHGKIWKTGWHSCYVRSQFWDVRTPKQWMISNLNGHGQWWFWSVPCWPLFL